MYKIVKPVASALAVIALSLGVAAIAPWPAHPAATTTSEAQQAWAEFSAWPGKDEALASLNGHANVQYMGTTANLPADLVATNHLVGVPTHDGEYHLFMITQD